MLNMIKRAVVSLVKKDNKQFATAQASYMGKVADTEIQTPYGLCSVAPTGSLLLMVSVQGQEENRVAFADLPQKRFKNLKEFEVSVGNYKTRAVIHFSENGDINIETAHTININSEIIIVETEKNINITADTINIKASTINIDADVNFTGALTSNGKNISDSHTHGGVQSGPGNTGGVS